MFALKHYPNGLKMQFVYHAFLILFIIFNLLLCTLILSQESKSMGLGASFGGDVSSSVFGTSTADVLKKMTAWAAIIFISTSLVLSSWTASIGSRSLLAPTQQESSR